MKTPLALLVWYMYFNKKWPAKLIVWSHTTSTCLDQCIFNIHTNIRSSVEACACVPNLPTYINDALVQISIEYVLFICTLIL